MNVGSSGGSGGGSQFLGGLDDAGGQPDPVTYICGGESSRNHQMPSTMRKKKKKVDRERGKTPR